jgi:hypothetical protein
MCNLCLTSMPGGWTAAPEALFKRDRPRAIDRVIDYFGDSAPRAVPRDLAEDRALEASA